MNRIGFGLFLFVVCLAFSQVSYAQLDVGSDKPTFEASMFYDVECNNNLCQMNSYMAPEWYNDDGNWKRTHDMTYKVNGTWVIYPYDKVDYDTFLWVEYCRDNKGERECYVCRNVSANTGLTPVPFTKGDDDAFSIPYTPGVKACNLYKVSDYSYFKFGAASTEITLFVNNTLMDGHLERIDDGSPAIGVATALTTAKAGMWNRASPVWNYTWQSFWTFDTSPIPDTATVNNVTFRFQNNVMATSTVFKINMTVCDIGVALDTTDWNRSLTGLEEPDILTKTDGYVSTVSSVGHVADSSVANLSGNTYYRIIDLSTTNVNKTGNTTYCMRTIDETPIPIAGDEDSIKFWTVDSTGRDPTLIVYYTVGAPDTTPPDLTFVSPTLANNTETQNASYIFVNVSSTETPDLCRFDNGTNTTMTIVADSCWINLTGLGNRTYQTFIVYANDSSGNLNTTEFRNITVNFSDASAPVPPDTTFPDITWIDPTTNGTEDSQKNYILWNISSNEDLGDCFIEINASNKTGTITNATTNTYCIYNQTGITGNNTHCAYGFGSDASGNTNQTIPYICRTTNLSVSAAGPSTFLPITPIFIFDDDDGDIEIAFALENIVADNVTVILNPVAGNNSAQWNASLGTFGNVKVLNGIEITGSIDAGTDDSKLSFGGGRLLSTSSQMASMSGGCHWNGVSWIPHSSLGCSIFQFNGVLPGDFLMGVQDTVTVGVPTSFNWAMYVSPTGDISLGDLDSTPDSTVEIIGKNAFGYLAVSTVATGDGDVFLIDDNENTFVGNDLVVDGNFSANGTLVANNDIIELGDIFMVNATTGHFSVWDSNPRAGTAGFMSEIRTQTSGVNGLFISSTDRRAIQATVSGGFTAMDVLSTVNGNGLAGSMFKSMLVANNGNVHDVWQVGKSISNGVGASGMGASFVYSLENDNNENVGAVRHYAVWSDVTNDSEVADFVIDTMNAGSLSEAVRFKGDNTMIVQGSGEFVGQLNVTDDLGIISPAAVGSGCWVGMAWDWGGIRQVCDSPTVLRHDNLAVGGDVIFRASKVTQADHAWLTYDVSDTEICYFCTSSPPLATLHVASPNDDGLMFTNTGAGQRRSSQIYHWENTQALNTVKFYVSDGTLTGQTLALTLDGDGGADVPGNFTSNLFYGEMWNYSPNASAWDFHIDTANIYYNLTNISQASNCNGFAHTNAKDNVGGSYLTAQVAGLYKASLALSMEAAENSALYGTAIVKNFDVNNQRNCYVRRDIIKNAAGVVAVTCFIRLAVGDDVNIQIENEVSDRDLRIHSANLNLVRIGD